MYGKIFIGAFGKVRPETRNAAFANMIELLNVTENRYSGILPMCSEFANAGLPAPLFSVVHGEFKVVMRNVCRNNDDWRFYCRVLALHLEQEQKSLYLLANRKTL